MKAGISAYANRCRDYRFEQGEQVQAQVIDNTLQPSTPQLSTQQQTRPVTCGLHRRTRPSLPAFRSR